MGKIHAVIGIKEIHIYNGNEQFEYSRWGNEIVEVSSFKWSNKNHLEITGVKQDWIYNSSISTSDIERQNIIQNVEEEFIINNKFLFFEWKSLLKGYIRMKKRIPYHKVFVNFRVVIHND